MDDPRWLRLIIIGLVLAAFAVGYFLLTGGLAVNKSNRVANKTTQPSEAVESPSPTVIPTASVQPSSSASPSPSASGSAYSRIVERNQSGAQTLPRTGFPVGLAIVFSVSAMVTGFSLRKYPK